MAAKLYVIPNWQRDYENARSESIGRVSYITLPNHFDGKRISRLKALPNPQALHGAFVEIVQVASKCVYRGVLLDHDGPLSALDLAAKTGFPAKGFETALQKLALPTIGLLACYEIEPIDGKWELPGDVKTWALTCEQRTTLKATRGTAETRSATERHAAPRKAVPKPEQNSAQRHAETRNATGSHAETRGDPRGDALPRVSPIQNRTEQKGTEIPPAVPPGGLSESDPKAEGETISNADEAKALICRLILGGKNAARPWGNEAMHDLAKHLPIPRSEIELIGRFRAVPKNDAIPELKFRPDILTETILMRDWSDWVTRAAAFEKKYPMVVMQKKEPPLWREFFVWKYDAGVKLPATFEELPADQRAEYDRDFATFKESEEGKAAA